MNMESIAKAIHYPDCWDTMAYPTLESALDEMFAWFKCSECGTAQAAPAVPELTDDMLRAFADRHDPYLVGANVSELRSLIEDARTIEFAAAPSAPAVSAEAVRQVGGSIPRSDLAKLPEVAKHKPISKGEQSFQQFDGANVAQWHVCPNGGQWFGAGPLFIISESVSAEAKDTQRLDFITEFGSTWHVQWERRPNKPARFRMINDGEPFGKWHPTARAAIDAAIASQSKGSPND